MFSWFSYLLILLFAFRSLALSLSPALSLSLSLFLSVFLSVCMSFLPSFFLSFRTFCLSGFKSRLMSLQSFLETSLLTPFRRLSLLLGGEFLRGRGA